MKTIQEIAETNGYQSKDNRSFDWRNINKAMGNGFIVEVAPKGKYWVKKEFKYNIRISNNGKAMFFYRKSISQDECLFANAIIESIGRFCEVYPVKYNEEKSLCKCGKCNGKGKILAFMHYAKGVCFDCMGLGYLQDKSVVL